MSTATSSTNTTALFVSTQDDNGGYGPLHTFEVETKWLLNHLTAEGEQHIEIFLNNYTAADAEGIYAAARKAGTLTKDLTPRTASVHKPTAR